MRKKNLAQVQRRMATQRAVSAQLDELLDESALPKRHLAKAHDVRRSPMINTLPARFDSPESSTILAASYDEATATLTVHFKRGKSDKTAGVYRYDHFPRELWQRFVEAESKGSYFVQHIRPVFAGVPVAA